MRSYWKRAALLVFLFSIFVLPFQARAECNSTHQNTVSFIIHGELFRKEISFSVDRKDAEINTKDSGYIVQVKKGGPKMWGVELIRVNTQKRIDTGTLYKCFQCPQTPYYIRWKKAETTKGDVPKDVLIPNVYSLCSVSDAEFQNFNEKK